MTKSTSAARDAALLDAMLAAGRQYVEHIQQTAERCHSLTNAEATAAVEDLAAKSLETLSEQTLTWRQRLDSNKEHISNFTSTSAMSSDNSDKLSRVAAMGGLPALGRMALPKLLPDQLHNLSATASPAAQEVHAAQGHSVDPSAQPSPDVKTPQSSTQSPPWMVELRARQQASRPSSRPTSPPSH